MEKLSAIPGVESAGGANPLPLTGNISNRSFMVSGAAPLPRGNHPGAGYLIVKPDYFKAMKIPLLQGRAFNRADTKDSPLVVMINEAFARKLFPGPKSNRSAGDDRPAGEQGAAVRSGRRRRQLRGMIPSPSRQDRKCMCRFRTGSSPQPRYRPARLVHQSGRTPGAT